MNLIYIILLVLMTLVLVFLFTYLMIGYSIYKFYFSRKGKFKRKIEKNFKKEEEENLSYWDKEKLQKLELQSEDEFKLIGFHEDNDSNCLAFLIHDFGKNHIQMTNYVDLFKHMNFDILTIDLRAHGESEGEYLSMGFRESNDILLWLDKILEIKSYDKIVLLGIGLGASSICLNIDKMPKQVIAIIEEGCYDTASKELLYLFSKSKIKIFYKLFNNYLLKTQNLNLKYINLCDKLKKSKIPVLILHDEKDELVPIEMSNNLYNSLPENLREIKILKNEENYDDLSLNKNLFNLKIKSFIKNIKN